MLRDVRGVSCDPKPYLKKLAPLLVNTCALNVAEPTPYFL